MRWNHRRILEAAAGFFCCALSATAAPGDPPTASHRLRISENHRYLADSVTGQPVFVLADTAWNLGALKLDEIEAYLTNRSQHGFNFVMFALNFSPQADEANAYGEPAYRGTDKTELNPAYFEKCDQVVRFAEQRGLYLMIYSMWAGVKAGTMNHYTPDQLYILGQSLGRHYAGVPNVIFCAGGESTPPYVDVERVNALGRGLKAGCSDKNLITVHPVAGHASSDFYGQASWLDFDLIQAKSGNGPVNAAYDAAALVLRDWNSEPVRPTMMGEHRYESGVAEDPLIQRRSLYQCVFAGGCGYAYGHDALWQMTPHTAQPWMLKGWNPGVANWREALNTPAVSQLSHLKTLLSAYPYFERIPDQSVIAAGQGSDVAGRIQACRDGSTGRSDATYLLAYLSAPTQVTIDTSVIAASTLNAYWFDPASGAVESIGEKLPNRGTCHLLPRADGHDAVLVVEDSQKRYRRPSE